MDKAKRKEILKQLAEKNLAEFTSALPIDEAVFLKLFDFIDEQLGEQNCQRDFRIASTFCARENLDENLLFDWLRKQGTFCDCEILNREDDFQYLIPEATLLVNKTKERSTKLTTLKTDFGLHIEKIPPPWLLLTKNSYGKANYIFKLGKSNNCTIDVDYDFPFDFFDNDSFWMNLWFYENELEYDPNEMSIERQEYEKYVLIIVKTKRWTPVVIWIKHNSTDKWFFKMKTELGRYKGDIKEVERLLNSVNLNE